MKLYEIESKYRDLLDECISVAEDGCTLKEFLELGFNNATLLNPFEEDTDTKDIENLYFESDLYYKLDENMLNSMVLLSSTYEDFDGYTCAYIELKDSKDWEYFKELEEM